MGTDHSPGRVNPGRERKTFQLWQPRTKQRGPLATIGERHGNGDLIALLISAPPTKLAPAGRLIMAVLRSTIPVAVV